MALYHRPTSLYFLFVDLCVSLQCIHLCFRKCKDKKTERPYAVKIISRRVDVNREVTLLKLCQGHANIVELRDVYYDEVRIKIQHILILCGIVAFKQRSWVSS